MIPGKNWENLKKGSCQKGRNRIFQNCRKTAVMEAGNQAGIDYAVEYLEPDYIMIANPDVQVSDTCILWVADALENRKTGSCFRQWW